MDAEEDQESLGFVPIRASFAFNNLHTHEP